VSKDEKTLLPELLPTPAPLSRATPRERVAERARLLLERFRGLGATAGAAIFSLQCSSGYGVVDPMPPPAQQCGTKADPLAEIHGGAFLHVGDSGTTDSGAPALPSVDLYVSAFGKIAYTGFRIDAVRVTGGTLVSTIPDLEGTVFVIRIAPAAAPSTMFVEVDLGCGAIAGTKRYRISYRPPAEPLVQELPPVKDAGPG
jgi:hypothetical protein